MHKGCLRCQVCITAKFVLRLRDSQLSSLRLPAAAAVPCSRLRDVELAAVPARLQRVRDVLLENASAGRIVWPIELLNVNLRQLPLEEGIRLVEDPWDSIAADQNALPHDPLHGAGVAHATARRSKSA
jgi:hypothetical protein